MKILKEIFTVGSICPIVENSQSMCNPIVMDQLTNPNAYLLIDNSNIIGLISYRIIRIAGTQFTSDCGWGCMIRSGQMLLAQTFLFHFLGRNWRWSGAQSDKEDMIHRMIVKWFGDEPLESCSPFSVHQFIRIAQGMGKKAGDWFGPASVAHILK